MTKKLKVLMCSEASFISSGFGTYANQVLKRLHATNKYDLAEFASYGKVNDPQDVSIHWKYYANAVGEQDPRHAEYSSSSENQFGRWRFEKVLLDFKPDVVFDVRDYWMSSYQQMSPLRPFYHWILMPTVDSAPQQEDWIDTFLHADAIFAYSDFGKNTMLQQSNNRINFIDVASPAVDLDVFKPLENKEKIRQYFGLDPNIYLVGSVMRNQKRKLIPELFLSFRKLLDKCQKENIDIGTKLYLYLHTSYPDAGWDIPELLKEYKIGNKVYFTYTCRSCNHVFASLFAHPIQYCKKCGNKSAMMPNVNMGVPDTTLAQIINMFDLYVQYAICEGFGMPQVEAAACGIPIASTDYSAMSDIVKNLNGYPIRINQYFKELETKAIRVYPDNNHLIEIILDFFKMPELLRKQKSFETRKLTESYYDWDIIAKKWEKYLDNLNLTGLQGKWDEAVLPELSSIEQPKEINSYYEWLFSSLSNYLPGHQLQTSIISLNLLRYLDYGFVQNGSATQKYTIEEAIKTLNVVINNNNLAAQAQQRIKESSIEEDFIKYAHMKDQTQ